MSLFNTRMVKAQRVAFGELIRGQSAGLALGILLLPTFTYKKGLLYKLEAQARESIATAGVFTDRSCFFKVSDKEERSERPLIIKGTIVLCENESDTLQIWKETPAIKDSMVDIGPQLRTKDMVTVASPSLTALPTTTDQDTHQSQAEKHNQIGVEASTRILNSFLTGLKPGRRAVLVADLSMRTADMLKGFLQVVHSSPGLPISYLGLCEDEEVREFAKQEALHFPSSKSCRGEWKAPPGTTIPPEELPQQDEDVFNKPGLHVLQWTSPRASSVKLAENRGSGIQYLAPRLLRCGSLRRRLLT